MYIAVVVCKIKRYKITVLQNSEKRPSRNLLRCDHFMKTREQSREIKLLANQVQSENLPRYRELEKNCSLSHDITVRQQPAWR